MDWPPSEQASAEGTERWDQSVRGPQLVKEYQLRSTLVLTSCSTCHR